MKVRLLEITQNPISVIYCAARQCYSNLNMTDVYPLEEDTEEHKLKLINHVLNSGHHSVLEHVNLTFAISGISRNTSHQIVRNRIASFSEKSQRYCNVKDSNFVIPPEIQKNEELNNKFIEMVNKNKEIYNYLVSNNIKEEDARFILPSCIETALVVTYNVRELIHIFSDRLCSLAQWEFRNVANEMLKICKKEIPAIFEKIGPKCQQLGYCPESKKRSCGRKKTRVEIFIDE